MSTEDNKAVVVRWFTDFWGPDFDAGVIDELAARGRHRLARHRRHPDLEREDEPLRHQRRARLLALEPHED